MACFVVPTPPAGAGKPEHVVYEASKMLLTSNDEDVDEGDYCRLKAHLSLFDF